MSQAYRELLGSDLLGQSYGYLNDSTRANRTLFSGATEPASPASYQLWADTTSGLLKMRTGANDDWISLGTLGSATLGLLSRAGGSMSGSIDMNGQPILNLGLGTGAAAARQQELDLKAPLASPLFTTDAQLNVDPGSNNSLVRRSWSEGRYVKITGSTLTGPTVLAGNAAADLEAVPLQQLRDFTAFNLSSGHRHDGVTSRKQLGTDLDAAGSNVNDILKSTGSGNAPAWAALKGVFGATCPFGSVSSGGAIVGAGSGNWSVNRAGTGLYDVTVTSGVLASNPVMLAVQNSPSDSSLQCACSKISGDVVRVRVGAFSGANTDAAFSFLFL